MESGASRRGARGRKSRASARDEETMADDTEHSGEENETGALLAAAIIGAAVGAGLGLLAGRALDTDMAGVVIRSARKRVRHGLKRGRRAAASAGSAAGDAWGDASGAVSKFAAHARDR